MDTVDEAAGQPAETIINYKCPNCGAPLAFGIESQKWDCHFCCSSFSENEAEKFEANTAANEDSSERAVNGGAFDDEGTAVYVCPSCGGRVITDKNTASTFCVYCHNPTIIAAKLEGEYRPLKLIPFKKTREYALEKLQKKVSQSPFIPSGFKEAAKKGEITGLYVPYWLFSADYQAMLYGTATKVSSWSDQNFRYTKTDYYHVERGACLSIDKVPVDASTRMDDKLMEAIEPFDYDELIDFNMQYLSGHHAESYDLTAEQCSQRYVQRAEGTVNQTMRGLVTGYATVSVDSLKHNTINQKNTYVMLPVWTMTASYKGKVYTYAMNGQTGKIIGKLPISWSKAGIWFGLMGLGLSILFLLWELFL